MNAIDSGNIRVCKNYYAGEVKFLAGVYDSTGDFASVCDQNAFDGWPSRFIS